MGVAFTAPAAMAIRLSDAGLRPVPERARSSAVEHTLHTGGVTGSIPVAPTMASRALRGPIPGLTRPFIAYSMLSRLRNGHEPDRKSVRQGKSGALGLGTGWR